MPELAAIYSMGVLTSLMVTICHHWLHFHKIRSEKWQRMQKNLVQAGLYWSETRGELVRHRAGDSEADLHKFVRQVWILGGLMGLLAWLGVFLQILIIVSMRLLLKSQVEKKLFSSQLVAQDFTASEVTSVIRELLIETPTN